MRQVGALAHFPPGLLPLMASFLAPDSIFVAGGGFVKLASAVSGFVKLASAVCYSVNTNSWRTNVPSMHTARGGPATVAIGGRMLVFGGIDAMGYSRPLATCEAFDPITNRWTAMPSMSTARAHACAVVWRGISLQAFVFGGRNSYGELSSVECFDPTLNQWSAVAPMTIARSRAAAVILSGRGLVVMGGYNITGVQQSAELYDPATDQWTTMSWELPKRLCDFGAHCIDGILYILGGSTSECWSMDLTAEVPIWSPLPPLPTTLAGLSSVAL